MADDILKQQTEVSDVIVSYRKNLEYNAKDEDLITAINTAITESRGLKDIIDRIGDNNRIYWEKGTNIDTTKYHKKKSRTIVNRIFTDIETAIPILSSNTPTPTIISEADNNIKNNIQRGLELAYEIKYKMQQKLQCICRHWFLFRIGVLKYRWDADNGFITENVIPKKIGIDKRATSIENCEYVWEELEDSVENLIEKFSSKKKEIEALFGTEKTQKSKVKYIEFWGGNGEWVCWKMNEIILDKMKNPNWDYENKDNNIFKQQRFPYIFLNVLNLQDNTSLYDNTSLIEVAIPAQDGVNKLEQQILDLNEGQKRVWVVSGEAMSEKKSQDLVDKTGDLLVYLDRKAPTNSITQVQSGKPDASMYNDLTHLLSEIDNVIGIHSTTRGERAQQETLGGRQLLMSSDYGRLDLIVRNVEQVIEEWYNAYLHMIKVYSDIAVVLNGPDEEKISLDPNQIPTDIIVMVEKGSTLPTDDTTKMNNAKELASAGMIDPATLFEEMGYPDVEKRVQDLYMWLQATGKIVPQAAPSAPAGAGTGQTPAVGGAPAGGATASPQEGQQQQLMRLNQIMQSPEFQSMPDEQKAQVVQQARQILEAIKSQV